MRVPRKKWASELRLALDGVGGTTEYAAIDAIAD